jgi:hypothetical protein
MNDKDNEVIRIYVETLMDYIADARAKVMKAGAMPRVMYIGDIFPREKDELRPSAIKLDTMSTVFGMRIIADYRVPKDKFYITQGEL